MKKIHYILLATISFTIASSCKKFDQLNTNPDVPTSVSPDLLATTVLKSTYRFWNPNPTDWVLHSYGVSIVQIFKTIRILTSIFLLIILTEDLEGLRI